MGYDATGKVYIEWDDYVDFVKKYLPDMKGAFIRIADPATITQVDNFIEVEYAFSTDCDPKDWANPPGFLKKK